MNAARLKSALVLLLAVVAFLGAARWRPTQMLADTRPKVALKTMFPERFGDWSVDDRQPVQLVSPDQQTLLTQLYSETLSRVYINKTTGQRVMLSVAYGQNQSEGTRAHLPEVCYPAQGFQLLDKERGTMVVGDHSIPVQHILTRQGERREPVTYWVVVGDRIALSGPQQKLAQLHYTTRGYVPDGLLFRVSNIDADARKSYALHQAFVRDLVAAFEPAWRVRAFGAT